MISKSETASGPQMVQGFQIYFINRLSPGSLLTSCDCARDVWTAALMAVAVGKGASSAGSAVAAAAALTAATPRTRPAAGEAAEETATLEAATRAMRMAEVGSCMHFIMWCDVR